MMSNSRLHHHNLQRWNIDLESSHHHSSTWPPQMEGLGRELELVSALVLVRVQPHRKHLHNRRNYLMMRSNSHLHHHSLPLSNTDQVSSHHHNST